MIINIIVSRNSSVVNSRGFLVSPAPLTVAVGTETVFQCQHLNADFITWRINGLLVSDFPDIVLVHHNGSFSSLTMVECIALFLGTVPLQETASASMVIQGTCTISDTLN